VTNELVTLEQAQAQCRTYDAADESALTLYIRAASRAVLAYLDGASFLDSDGNVPTDSNGNPDGVPEDVQLAALFLVGEFYRNREAEQDGAMDSQFGYGYLPRPVVALLYPYRSPVLG
jgi:hypothetical protein